MAKQWSALTDQNMCRIDCLYGWKAYRPEWIVRTFGAGRSTLGLTFCVATKGKTL